MEHPTVMELQSLTPFDTANAAIQAARGRNIEPIQLRIVGGGRQPPAGPPGRRSLGPLLWRAGSGAAAGTEVWWGHFVVTHKLGLETTAGFAEVLAPPWRSRSPAAASYYLLGRSILRLKYRRLRDLSGLLRRYSPRTSA